MNMSKTQVYIFQTHSLSRDEHWSAQVFEVLKYEPSAMLLPIPYSYLISLSDLFFSGSPDMTDFSHGIFPPGPLHPFPFWVFFPLQCLLLASALWISFHPFRVGRARWNYGKNMPPSVHKHPPKPAILRWQLVLQSMINLCADRHDRKGEIGEEHLQRKSFEFLGHTVT